MDLVWCLAVYLCINTHTQRHVGRYTVQQPCPNLTPLAASECQHWSKQESQTETCENLIKEAPPHTHTLDPSCVIVMTAELGAGCEELTPVLAEVVAQTGADLVLWNNLGWDRRQPGNTIPFFISLEYQWMLAL